MVDKSLGQHWLYNREILEKIAELAINSGAPKSSEKPPEICVEIGPGLGTLTSSLLKRFKKVIAIEFDKKLAENLPKSFPGKDLEVINEDILKFDFNSIKESFSVAGNIPYYITSPIIEKLLTLERKPERIVLLIQKEVAERILDEKGTVLSLFVKNSASVKAGPVVLREEFTPPPNVDSEVIILEPFSNPRVNEEVFKLIKVGFKAPRKKLISNLVSMREKEGLEEIFKELGFDLNTRPADLKLEDWEKLYKKLQK